MEIELSSGIPHHLLAINFETLLQIFLGRLKNENNKNHYL